MSRNVVIKKLQRTWQVIFQFSAETKDQTWCREVKKALAAMQHILDYFRINLLARRIQLMRFSDWLRFSLTKKWQKCEVVENLGAASLRYWSVCAEDSHSFNLVQSSSRRFPLLERTISKGLGKGIVHGERGWDQCSYLENVFNFDSL